VLTSVAIHFEPKTTLPLTRAYLKGLTFHTGRVHSRGALPDALACVCGGLNTAHVTHRVADFADAAIAMDDPGPKLIFRRDAVGPLPRTGGAACQGNQAAANIV
jgi:hypothetical protein